MALAIFWLSAVLLVYTYVGYPVLITLVARLRARPVKKDRASPRVTVIVTAYNEQAGIAEKIANILDLDYPVDKLDVIVASDASTDATDSIVLNLGSERVILHRVEGRRGKTACQNSAASVARGDILVFTDATTRLDPNCIKAMVANFSDARVGCVAGALCYVSHGGSGTGQGGVAYWDYELKLRRAETMAHGLIGVSGCLYAVRRSAYLPIRDDLISDFCIAMRMEQQNLRTVLEEEAICYENTLDETRDELAMRVRVAVRSIHALRSEISFLNPFAHGLFAVELLSHKALRYMSPLLWAAMIVANLLLLEGPLSVLVLAAQLAVIGLGLLGFLSRNLARKHKLLSRPYYFLLTNLASLLALGRILRGDRIVTWSPVR